MAEQLFFLVYPQNNIGIAYIHNQQQSLRPPHFSFTFSHRPDRNIASQNPFHALLGLDQQSAIAVNVERLALIRFVRRNYIDHPAQRDRFASPRRQNRFKAGFFHGQIQFFQAFQNPDQQIQPVEFHRQRYSH